MVEQHTMACRWLLGHLRHACIWGIVTKGPAGRSTLNHFKLVNITLGVGAPN